MEQERLNKSEKRTEVQIWLVITNWIPFEKELRMLQEHPKIHIEQKSLNRLSPKQGDNASMRCLSPWNELPLLMLLANRNPQTSKHYRLLPLFLIISGTWWQQCISEDTTYVSHSMRRNSAGTDLEASSLLGSFQFGKCYEWCWRIKVIIAHPELWILEFQ